LKFNWLMNFMELNAENMLIKDRSQDSHPYVFDCNAKLPTNELNLLKSEYKINELKKYDKRLKIITSYQKSSPINDCVQLINVTLGFEPTTKLIIRLNFLMFRISE